jgi:hypothetical protein
MMIRPLVLAAALGMQGASGEVGSGPGRPRVVRGGRGLKPWADSWEGIHTFTVWGHDYPDGNHSYDFNWSGGSISGNNSAEVGGYYASSIRDEKHNLSWHKTHRPDWVLYDCDRTTPSLQYAYKAVSLDFTNPEVLAYRLQCAQDETAGQTNADALAWDNFGLGNSFPKPGGGWGSFCGVWAKNGSWVHAASRGRWSHFRATLYISIDNL